MKPIGCKKHNTNIEAVTRRIRGKLLTGFFTALILCPPLSVWAEQLELEVITLKHRTAQDVLPVVQPFVNRAGGTVTGLQNQLIIRTTRANLAEVKQMLAAIDTIPRRLLVTVKQDNGLSATQGSAQLSGTAASGNARVVVPPATRSSRGLIVERQQSGNSLRAEVQGSVSHSDETNVQQLQVLEGREAYIQVGQSVPMPVETVVQTPQGAQVIKSSQFREAATGFYVRPRVSGELVTLEVSPQRERVGPDGTVIAQRIASVISGRLGEWMGLGGIAESQTLQNSGLASRDSERNSIQNRIYIKVDEIR